VEITKLRCVNSNALQKAVNTAHMVSHNVSNAKLYKRQYTNTGTLVTSCNYEELYNAHTYGVHVPYD